MNNFILQQVYERRWLLGVTSIVLMLFSVFVVSLYPVLSQLQPSNPIIENMPVLFEGFLGELSYLREFPTFLASQLFTIHLPLWLGVVAVMYGWSVSGAAENRGEFRAILARPTSRTMLALNMWAVMVVMVTVCMVIIALGVYLSLPLIEGETTIALSAYAALILMAWLYAFAVATLTFAVGTITARRSMTVLIGLSVVIVGYYVTIMSSVIPITAGYHPFSLLQYVSAVNVIEHGLTLSHVMTLIIISLGAIVLSIFAFQLRDVTR